MAEANTGPRPGALTGLRVIDSAAVWAMPLATTLLGDMGAEVIKVESTNRIDTRGTEPFFEDNPTSDYFNRSGIFGSLNRGKKSVTINIRSEEGKQLYKDLVAKTDVLVENNRPGVMKRLGLDYPVLSQVNPSLIMLSNSGYGQTGPWTTYGAIALSLEPTTGLSHFTGYKGGPPVRWNWFTDFPTAMTAVFAILGALRHKRQTGEGQWIDLCMYEVGVSMLGEHLLDYTVNGHTAERRGNRDFVYAPQGAYPCAGDDRWVGLSVRSDAEWQALCGLMGKPEMATDARFATVEARHENHDLIDEEIADWTRGQDSYDVMRLLQEEGIPGGVVQNMRDVYKDQHMRTRGFWQWVGDDTAAVGPQPYITGPWRLNKTPMRIKGPSPRLGQNNKEILGGLLGFTDEELVALESRDVIGDRPVNEGYVPRGLAREERIARGRWQEHNPDWLTDIRRDLGGPA